jgi:hypothetical protein
MFAVMIPLEHATPDKQSIDMAPFAFFDAVCEFWEMSAV